MDVFPKLVTERLILRQFQDDDLENVYQGLSHPNVVKYYAVSYNTLEATRNQLAWFKALEKEKNGIWWAVCDKETKEFLGAIGLNNMTQIYQKAEIGFWLLPNYWASGIIVEAAKSVCDYAFSQLKLNRIEAFVESANENSKKVLSKLSFNHEGTMNNCEIKNNQFVSLAIYAKLNSH
ncbi:N-acetyltransferase [Pedobacter frigidisoli]|uniref:N-acetyltransferase n=1 Tax=Pedobacter frigidisoli TaxID=2530455 RepID=A0A4V2MNH9_9SPHI|nr:GNAT family N-acetyltransferase [Pedobacter frigidisoli]TCD12896.1 N-acetyltransferase [Pedobacter frigidisoli]